MENLYRVLPKDSFKMLALLYKDEREAAERLVAEQRAVLERSRHLWRSYVNEAAALRRTRRVGYRFASLDRLPDIPPNPETGAPGYRGWRNGDNSPFRYEGRDWRAPTALNEWYLARGSAQRPPSPPPARPGQPRGPPVRPG